MEVYKEATQSRLVQMRDANIRMDYDVSSVYAGATKGGAGT